MERRPGRPRRRPARDAGAWVSLADWLRAAGRRAAAALRAPLRARSRPALPAPQRARRARQRAGRAARAGAALRRQCRSAAARRRAPRAHASDEDADALALGAREHRAAEETSCGADAEVRDDHLAGGAAAAPRRASGRRRRRAPPAAEVRARGSRRAAATSSASSRSAALAVSARIDVRVVDRQHEGSARRAAWSTRPPLAPIGMPVITIAAPTAASALALAAVVQRRPRRVLARPRAQARPGWPRGDPRR